MGGRKGWRSVEVPEGWLQVIRGPRPLAAKWPPAQHKSSAAAQDKVPTTDRTGGRWRNRGVDPDTRKGEGGETPEDPHRIGNPRRPGGRCHQEIVKEGTRGCAGTPNPRVGEGVQEFMDQVHQAESPSCKRRGSPSSGEPVRVWQGWRHSKLRHQPPLSIRHGAQVVNLQQMVNQLQAERDALCMELRQSRVKQEWVKLSTLFQQRGLRRGARHTRCPTAVVSPSVLDALEFDLTVEDPTGGDEGSQMPVPQARPSAFAPEAGVTMMFTERTSSFLTVGVGGHSTRQHSSNRIGPSARHRVRWVCCRTTSRCRV